ncbi:MAG: dTDP-glucose 4,6-dehydratase [Desulfurococcus sp.]|nr:dTDP-glucose 4,6-dehydratase [Desulfurococcus sp.]
MRLYVTGGAGFIGSNFVRYMLKKNKDTVILVYDKLTYAGRLENLAGLLEDKRLTFIKGDIVDSEMLSKTLREFKPDVVVNFAAETHVDRSIVDPAPFIETNIKGVFQLLEATRRLEIPLLIHISTDEVYGDRLNLPPASEEEKLQPSSPYSASKAAGDLLIAAYWRTYRIPAIIVRPSNNYGPYQYPEKLIPRVIIRALSGKPIPVYGGGSQIRDWLYVEDFAEALEIIISKGRTGEIYNVPGGNEKKNIEVVKDILRLMGKPETLIHYTEDRPGHDYRYSMTGDKIRSLGWKPRTPWLEGLKKTIEWYLSNEWWWRPLLDDYYLKKEEPWR